MEAEGRRKRGGVRVGGQKLSQPNSKGLGAGRPLTASAIRKDAALTYHLPLTTRYLPLASYDLLLNKTIDQSID